MPLTRTSRCGHERHEAIVVHGLRAGEDLDERAAAAIEGLPASLPVLVARSDDELRDCFDRLWDRGIGPAAVLVVDADAADLDLGAIVGHQVRLRLQGALPRVGKQDGWTLERDHLPDALGERVEASLFTVSSGRVGVRGDLEDRGPGSTRLVMVAGAYGCGPDGVVRPLPAPVVTDLGPSEEEGLRVLDLRSGVLERRGPPGTLRSVRFASLVRPDVVALRAEHDRPPEDWPDPLGPPLESALAANHRFSYGDEGDAGASAETISDRATVVAQAEQRTWSVDGGSRMERVASFRVQPRSHRNGSSPPPCVVSGTDFDDLLDEHRREWARRWSTADIEIGGDADSQLAVRYALFHVLSCATTTGESAVGARGLTGLAYAGHVFWDTDVFVLPVLAATLPRAARAVLQYRINRLPEARRRAAARGLPGARFPWESADTGNEVTPPSTRGTDGRIIPIRTSERAEHINADVAWAALHYADWTGDRELISGPGRPLVLDTARYWERRVRVDDEGRGHLYGVIGPDEYHEIVDDNAFTNGMVRWHLRRAAELLTQDGELAEAHRLRDLGDSMVTGYDPVRGRHEQFAGFDSLDELLIGDVASPPVAADVLLGRSVVQRTQVSKQPDVLMLHHLLPDSVPVGSLSRDLEHYLPHTAHGSSLSPAIVASLLARAGRPDEAMELFDMAARLDLDDLTETTGAGLHLATMGGLWQAVVRGFAGISPRRDGLRVDPRLPVRWDSLGVRLLFRGVPVHVRIDHREVSVESDVPLPILTGSRILRSPARWPVGTQRKDPS